MDSTKTRVRFGRVKDACVRYSLSENMVKKAAKQADAVRKFERCTLYDFEKLDQFFTDLGKEGNDEQI